MCTGRSGPPTTVKPRLVSGVAQHGFGEGGVLGDGAVEPVLDDLVVVDERREVLVAAEAVPGVDLVEVELYRHRTLGARQPERLRHGLIAAAAAEPAEELGEAGPIGVQRRCRSIPWCHRPRSPRKCPSEGAGPPADSVPASRIRVLEFEVVFTSVHSEVKRPRHTIRSGSEVEARRGPPIGCRRRGRVTTTGPGRSSRCTLGPERTESGTSGWPRLRCGSRSSRSGSGRRTRTHRR